MELRHIDIANLSVSPVNMRGGRKTPDLANILPSIRARGVLVPLIVRPNGKPDHYEIVAGRRRYHASLMVAEEAGGLDPLPCAVIEAGDDAAALEASLIENVARLDPDEVTRWEGFTRLVREGRSPEAIAATFGLTPVQVKRTLALGNLLPRLRSLYRAEKIDAMTIRHLTLANKAQQRDWLALLDDESAYAPTGSALKAWLFGGASILSKAALFDLSGYTGGIVSDLFGEESWFANATAFWTAQRAEIEARAGAYRDAGWSEVIVLPDGHLFQAWEHERCPKRKGGRVYIAVGSRGDVTFHEGYVTTREARRRGKGEGGQAPARAALPTATSNHVDLHRHAAVRSALTMQPMVAMRVMLAHVIAGSQLWRVSVEPQRPHNEAIEQSVENAPAEAAFDAKRRAVLALLGFDPDTPTVTRGHDGLDGIAGLFVRLCDLPDEAIPEILAVVMGETLDAGTPLIEVLGVHLGVDMAASWQADAALLDTLRDGRLLNAMLGEVAGPLVAKANATATGKAQRSIILNYLTGADGRLKAKSWAPRWMAYPPSDYPGLGEAPTVARWRKVAGLFEPAAAEVPNTAE